MKSVMTASAAVVAIFAPIKMAIITVFVLVIADLITGLMAAYKSKTPITSAGLRRTAIKLFLYEAALLLGFLAETFLTGASVPICKLVSAFVGLTEMKSVVENLIIIGGGSLFASLLSKLGSDNAPK